jgi:transmembrane sensor
MTPINDETLNDPVATHAAQRAAHWLATLTDANCTEAERQQFFEWLRSSTHNVDEFLRLSTLTRNASRRELWPDRSIDSLIAEARASTNVASLDGRHRSEPERVNRRPMYWGIAASLGCLIAISGLLMTGQLDRLIGQAYRTQVGEQRSIALSDGSVVELNSQSHLRTDFSTSLRAVELTEGEAIFRVAKDPTRPFRVRAGTAEIVAVGTAFNVSSSEARTVVTVLEGRVRVNHRTSQLSATARRAAQAENIELGVGEQLIVTLGGVAKLALPDTEKVTSWTERRLIFEETPLANAAAEFARYSPRQIHIADSQLGERRISGVFDATDPASLVEFLRSDESVAVDTQEDGWLLRSRSQ